MGTLSRTLEQAQKAVLGVQGDLTTLRAQLEDADVDGHSSRAVINPFYVELQGTVQEKQQVAADLLQKTAHQLFEVYRHVEARAARLTHVQDQEKQVSSAKKSMRRYLETQATAQQEATEALAGALRCEEMKVEHLETTAASLVSSTAERDLQRRVLFTWLKRAMVRVFAREQRDTQKGGADGLDIMAQRFSLHRLAEARTRKALHQWERRLHRRRLEKSQKELEATRTSAEFFQTELTQTQRLMSNQLTEVMARAQQTTQHQSSECDLLSDEVQRLKVALEEVTNEFSDRTRTYVRQQEEADLFYKRKEEKMQSSIDALQETVAALRCQNAQLKVETELLTSSALSHAEHASEAVASVMLRKSDLYASVVSDYCRRLKRYNLSLQEEVRQLRADVALLAPLGEKTVRLENQLAESADHLEQERVNVRALQKAQQQAGAMLVLLTDRLQTSEARQVRQAYWHAWKWRAERNLREDVEAHASELARHVKAKHTEHLLQQQKAAAEYREQTERVCVELEQRAQASQAIEQDAARDRARLAELEEQLYQVSVESANVAAQLARSRQQEHALTRRLAECQTCLVQAQEAQEHTALLQQEATFRSTLALREMALVQIWGASKAQELEQAAAVCESWQLHCTTQEAAFVAERSARHASAALALEGAELRHRTASAFAVWQHWAHARRLERDASTQLHKTREAAAAATSALQAQHSTTLDALATELTAATQRHSREAAALRTAHEDEVERLEQQLRQREHAALDLEAKLQAHRVALDKARESAERESHTREQAHAAALRDAADTMDATRRQLQKDHVAAMDAARHAHRLELLALQLNAEAETGRLQAQHTAQAQTQRSAHATSVAQLETELQARQDEIRALGATVVEYCARSAFNAWRAWLERRRRAALVVQVPAFTQRLTQFLAGRYNLLQDARTAQQEAFMTATEALVHRMREAHQQTTETAETHKTLMAQHVATLKNDAEAQKVAVSIAEARVAQLVRALQDARRAKEEAVDALHAAQSDADALREETRAAQAAHKEAESSWRLQCEAREARQRHVQAFEVAALQLQTDYCKTQLHEYALHQAALAEDFACAWREVTPHRLPVDTDLSSLGSDHKESRTEETPVFPSDLRDWVTQLEQATESLQASSSSSSSSSSAPSSSRSRSRSQGTGSAQRILDCLQESVGAAATSTSSGEEEGGRAAQSESKPPPSAHSDNTPDHVSSRRDAAQEVRRAIEVVRTAALGALMGLTRQHTAEVDTLQAQLASARQSLDDLRASMDDLLAENRALAADMKESAAIAATAATTTATISQPIDAQPQSSVPSEETGSDVWGERLDLLAQRYQRVLDAMYDTIQERRETFYSVNGMLVEVDTFSEELLLRFEDNVKAMQALQSRIQQPSVSPFDCMDFRSDAAGAMSTAADSPSPAPPLSPGQDEAEPLMLPPSRRATETTQPPVESDVSPSSSTGTPLPGQRLSHPASHSSLTRRSASGNSRSSTGREQLLDRVQLLEKLLVQAKLQIAQAREMAESTAASAAAAAASQPAAVMSEADCAAWMERATQDIESLQIPLTESQLVPLYAANAEAMVVCMDTLRQRQQAYALQSRRQEDVLESSLRAVTAQHHGEKQEWDSKVRQLTQTIQDLQQRHMEAGQQLQGSLRAAQDASQAQAAQADARLAAVTANYEQELAQLGAEVDRVQAELERARSTHREALASQKALLDIQCAETVQSYERQLRQLERERDREAQQREQADTALRTRTADHKRALDQLHATHEKALDALEARYSRYYVEQAQAHSAEEVSRSPQRRANVETFMSNMVVYLDRCTELIGQATQAKADVAVAAALRAVEGERESWETDVMQLRERLAHHEADACQDDTMAQQSRHKHVSASQPLPPTASEEAVFSTSPAALTASASPVTPHGDHETAEVPATHTTALESTPVLRDLHSPPVREPQSTTPIRVRGPSVDSLDLSQSMLRYSKLLSDQTDRNEERLHHASLLEAEVNDLIDRGTRLTEMAERSGLTPRRHRPR